MRIVMASSEAVPFSKTGGLADVATGLATALATLGHDVTLIVPYHRKAFRPESAPNVELSPTAQRIAVRLGEKIAHADLIQARWKDSSLRALLIDQPDYFDRPNLYVADGRDYPDNCERFVFFSRAVLEAARTLDLRPDVFHANDWQTGLIPALVDIEWRPRPEFRRTASTFTIHNMAFHGRFWRPDFPLTGIDARYFNWQQMEFHGDLNLLKTGIVFAHMVTTVSPTYAREICTPEAGWGLDGVLRDKGNRLVGILNGVDIAHWNPATDPHISANYTLKTVQQGKAACKRSVQTGLGLPERADVPLLAMISRMTSQKGFDLIEYVADELLRDDIQWCFLGTGEHRFERFIRELAQRHPGKVRAIIGFDEALSHNLEAAADIFVMPSQFEPCGLNQMYSMMYGTIPIVRNVGGLADSVVDANSESIASGTATGFKLHNFTPDSLRSSLQSALATFRDHKPLWQQLIHNGMSQDWSWESRAREYVAVYERALAQT